MEAGGNGGESCLELYDRCKAYSPIRSKVGQFAKIYEEGVQSGIREVQGYLEKLKNGVRELFFLAETDSVVGEQREFLEVGQSHTEEGETEPVLTQSSCSDDIREVTPGVGRDTNIGRSNVSGSSSAATMGKNSPSDIDTEETTAFGFVREKSSGCTQKDLPGQRQQSKALDIPDLAHLYKDDFLDIDAEESDIHPSFGIITSPKRLREEEFGFIMKSASRHKKSSSGLFQFIPLSGNSKAIRNIGNMPLRINAFHPSSQPQLTAYKSLVTISPGLTKVSESSNYGLSGPVLRERPKSTILQVAGPASKRVKCLHAKPPLASLPIPKKQEMQAKVFSQQRLKQAFSKSHKLDIATKNKEACKAGVQNDTLPSINTNPTQSTLKKIQTTGSVLRSLEKQWNLFTGKACTQPASKMLSSIRRKGWCTQKARDLKLGFSSVFSKPPFYTLKAPLSSLKTYTSAPGVRSTDIVTSAHATKSQSKKTSAKNAHCGPPRPPLSNPSISILPLEPGRTKASAQSGTPGIQEDIRGSICSGQKGCTAKLVMLKSDTIAEHVGDLPEPPSDYDSDDLLSSDCDESRRRDSKIVKKSLKRMGEPLWASTPEIVKALERQSTIDPDKIFLGARPPLEGIFKAPLLYHC